MGEHIGRFARVIEAPVSAGLRVDRDRTNGKIIQTFTRKGRFKDLMERMPIQIITTSGALFGAATLGLQSLSKLKNDEEPTVSLVPV